jgi:sn-glycerol 3-phosphate transport system ATP-binding protein
MNFFSAETAPDGVRLENGALLTHEHPHAGRLVVGVRPEDLVEAAEGPIRIAVRVVEQLGASSNVHGVLEGTETELVASLSGRQTPRPGDALTLAPKAGGLHLFDAESARRL